MRQGRADVAGIGDVTVEGFRPVVLETERGAVQTRWYDAPGTASAVIYVGGVGGGFDTPARQLYPRLATELTAEGVAGLRVRFRDPRDLGEAVYDVLEGARFLQDRGVTMLGLMGHSFGGAVVLQAGSRLAATRTVVCLSTQSYGADAVRDLPPDCSVLLIHGEADPVLSPTSSAWVHSIAHEPKALHLLPATGHVLDEAAEEVHDEVLEWLRSELRGRT